MAQELLDHAGTDARRALHAATLAGGSVVAVTSELMGRMAFGDRTDGVLAVAVAPDVSLDALTLPDEPLVAVVEAVEKPGNLGALLRSADGAGVDAVIVADPACDPWNPNAIRASLGHGVLGAAGDLRRGDGPGMARGRGRSAPWSRSWTRRSPTPRRT